MLKFTALVGIALCMCLTALAGCASIPDLDRMGSFNETAKTYKRMVFWSEYDAALSFRDPIGALSGDQPDMKARKEVRVTSYKVRHFTASADKSQVRQVVEIDYYRMDDMTVRTIEDQQLWVYNTEARRWYLRSGLPAFE